MTDLQPTRRTVVKGAAWAAPVILVSAPAPAFAASPSVNNSINGWVQIETEKRSNNSQGRFSMSSNVAGSVNGDPYGLYLIDTTIADTFSNAFIEVDILGNNNMSLPSPGPGWAEGSRVGTVTRDNRTYTRYRFNYSGIFDRRADDRVWLNNFEVTTPWYSIGNGGITYWVRRFVTINGQQRFFERRNGDLGFVDYYSGAPNLIGRKAAAGPVDAV